MRAGTDRSNAIVSLVDVEKWYGGNYVVKKVSLDILKGEFLTLLGPSGCGKTTMLRMISGFEDVTSGEIRIENESVEMKEPYERDVNTVFQNYALFPNLNVYDNIAYGLRVRKAPKSEIREKVMRMLEMVQLAGFEKRKIDQMSGGQKQRVAIARAIVNEPKVLLLDEPLGALDLKLRKQMQLELKRLQRKLGVTFVYVTHDQEEALTMSDRIAVMNAGEIEQIDEPERIYMKPKSRFVATFIGESNVFDAVVAKEGSEAEVAMECGSATVDGQSAIEGENVVLSVRPENLRYSTEPTEGFRIKSVVKEIIFVGNITRIIALLTDGQEATFTCLGAGTKIKEGQILYLSWSIEECVVIKKRIGHELEQLKRDEKEKISLALPGAV
ncbi:MAG: ABC transporter ATP-binding protein [Eubacteriaceae bacterium]|jgi:spermidine/putrescine transport system ATP-binding protein|nr:ABC transporter ATP-binding protein [Eubacteriaceae bacterium]